MSVLRALVFLGMLYLFLMAIGLLGGSFKMLGKDVAEGLIATTTNPFAGLLIGILATAIVQSSSLTTSLVVALVSGGALSVHNAVPIVMGANIGTTITNTIVSIGHIGRDDEFERACGGAVVHDVFNVLSVAVLFPMQLATGFLDRAAGVLSGIFYGFETGTFKSPVKLIVKPAVKAIHHLFIDSMGATERVAGILSVILALILIFVALSFMVRVMRKLTASKLEKWVHRIFSSNAYLVLIIGFVITAIVQSSSVTTSIMVPIVGAGLITLAEIFPITVGANIGTTVTALLATLAGNQAGLTIAFVHLLFNLCGTLLFFVPPFMRRIPISIAQLMAGKFVRQKKLVILYVVVVFFVLPLVGMLVTRGW